MRTMSGDDVMDAVHGCTEALRAALDQDWKGVKAGRLEWSCHKTVEHVASDLIAYAGQLAGRPQDRYVPYDIVLDDDADNEGLLEVLETTGTLLATTVRITPPEVRAFHPYPFRLADRKGFAAMGIAEVLLHTHDLAEGLGISYEPPRDLADAVLGWLFPHVQPGPAPWPTLLWATGRGDLPGRAPVTSWKWCNNLVLHTDRLDLVGVRPAVARDLALGGTGGFDWTGGSPHDGTREASAFLVKAYESGLHRPEFGIFVLVRRDTGQAVGGIGFHGTPDAGRVEIGYDLVPGARGAGHATEAVRALTGWALARDDVRSVVATVALANTASQAVVTRAGFRRVGEDGDAGEELTFELR
ncbi:GNAT family N-acetyltransferase [Streptomyces sp. J2-1]|uniref:GNAT family N-acetyltransferase n=1 Tax=Streptomyces corallincola TaxID=2851888 RepID=UPI001C39288B|nr:GNAT family N-acetyltransferase [Streptomyces corallincola]MBV2354693.1 GNAT family N-acetyltransferase [Streptomyces corallincola]